MKAIVLPAVGAPLVVEDACILGCAIMTAYGAVRSRTSCAAGSGSRVRTARVSDMPEIVALAAAGRISVTQPISRRYRLDQADEA